MWSLRAHGGGVLWLVGFQKHVKDLIGGIVESSFKWFSFVYSAYM